MASRLDLHRILESIPGVKKAYFQPPESVKLVYPCIIYNISRISSDYADNKKYFNRTSYSLTVIDRDPDSKIPAELLKLDFCTFDRFFVSDNLNHFVLTIYF